MAAQRAACSQHHGGRRGDGQQQDKRGGQPLQRLHRLQNGFEPGAVGIDPRAGGHIQYRRADTGQHHVVHRAGKRHIDQRRQGNILRNAAPAEPRCQQRLHIGGGHGIGAHDLWQLHQRPLRRPLFPIAHGGVGRQNLHRRFARQLLARRCGGRRQRKGGGGGQHREKHHDRDHPGHGPAQPALRHQLAVLRALGSATEHDRVQAPRTSGLGG